MERIVIQLDLFAWYFSNLALKGARVLQIYNSTLPDSLEQNPGFLLRATDQTQSTDWTLPALDLWRCSSEQGAYWYPTIGRALVWLAERQICSDNLSGWRLFLFEGAVTSLKMMR
jgi:hypothetical protein